MELQAQKLAHLESVIATSEAHVQNFVDAFRTIRDEKLFLSAGFKNFAAYCAEKWHKSTSTVKLALQIDDIRKDLVQTEVQRVVPHSNPPIQELATRVSDRAIRKLASVPPAKRPEVLRAAAAATNGKPTGKSIQVAAQKLAHRSTANTLPSYQPSRSLDFSSAYSSAPAPAVTTHVPIPPADPAAPLPPISDPHSAVAHLEAIYLRDKSWFNSIPPHSPRQFLDHLIQNIIQ